MKETFEDWMKKVDNLVSDVTGSSVYDLADCPFKDWYEDGMKASKAAAKAIKNELEGDY
jgi:hypothetical protein